LIFFEVFGFEKVFQFFEDLKTSSNLQARVSFLWVMWAFSHVELGSTNETSKRYARGNSSQFRTGQLGNVRGWNNTWRVWLGILASFQSRIPWPSKQQNLGL
jgi:hypothetical protein